MNQRSRTAVVVIAVIAVSVVGVVLFVNRAARRVDDQLAQATRGVGEGQPEAVDGEAAEVTTGNEAEPKPSDSNTARLPERLLSFRDYFRLAFSEKYCNVPSVPSERPQDLSDAIPRIQRIADIEGLEAVEFAGRLVEVLKAHKVSVPESLAESVQRDKRHLSPMTIHQRLRLAQPAVELARMCDRETRGLSSTKHIALPLACDLLLCMAQHAPDAMVSAGSSVILARSAVAPNREELTLGRSLVMKALEGMDASVAQIFSVSNGSWRNDCAFAAQRLGSFGNSFQCWLQLRLMEMEDASEAAANKCVDQLMAKVERVSKARMPEGGEEVVTLFRKHVGPSLREHAGDLVPVLANRKEVETSVQRLASAIAAEDLDVLTELGLLAPADLRRGPISLQTECFGDKASEIEIVCFRLGGIPNHREVGICFRYRDPEGQIRLKVLTCDFMKTPKGIRFGVRE